MIPELAAAPIYGLPRNVLFSTQLIFGLGALGSSVYCVYSAARNRTLLPIYILIGGGLCSLYEAWADVLGQAIYPEIGVPTMIEMLGRSIPLYVLFIYLFFFPAPYVALLERFRTGLAYRTWIGICLGVVLSAGLFEIPALHFRIWTYYGAYTWKVEGFPPVWAFMNGCGVLGGAALLHLVIRHLPQRRQAWLIVLVPLIFFGLHFATALPLYSTLNSTLNPVILAAGYWLSCLLGGGLSLYLGRLVCTVR